MRHVAVTGLHKAFGAHPVLTGVDLEVPAGSLTAILGPSGSGKTTLLRLMAGFEQADAGTISIGDALVDGPGVHVAPERRRIGYVPQEGSLFPHLTVEANVGFGLAVRERRGGKAAKMLEMVGLGGFGKRYPHQLSGGQQQRVALARALAIEPAVVLLDEPFASLDTHLRASVRADVQAIFRRAGTTAVLVTHDQDEALSVADRVAALRDGTIAQCAAPEDLYNRPADPELARFIGEANLLEGVLNGGVVKTLLGDLPLDPEAVPAGRPGQVTVLIRPEQIELDPGQDGMAGRVVSYGYHGHDAVVEVQPALEADGRTIIVRVTGGHHLRTGSLVRVRARGPVFAWARDWLKLSRGLGRGRRPGSGR
ncbi:MAG TPA: ABC transporter ATP-binding protein [Streptosporangiaceae bacterium]|nr:ABC transporter ATP-binding protein [Streptosporangiaceae bacterium]